MDTQQHLGLPAAVDSSATSTDNVNLSSDRLGPGESFQALPASSVEPKTAAQASSGRDWAKTIPINDPVPSQQPSDAQSDTASEPSDSSQNDNIEAAKPRTRRHFTRSKNNESQQNGDAQTDLQKVSTHSIVEPRNLGQAFALRKYT